MRPLNIPADTDPRPPGRPNGCHDRADFRPEMTVQDGWVGTSFGRSRAPKLVSIPFRMARDCRYTLTDLGQADAGCQGCRWRRTPEETPCTAPSAAA